MGVCIPGGYTTRYYSGNSIDYDDFHYEHLDGKTHSVGTKLPNHGAFMICLEMFGKSWQIIIAMKLAILLTPTMMAVIRIRTLGHFKQIVIRGDRSTNAKEEAHSSRVNGFDVGRKTS